MAFPGKRTRIKRKNKTKNAGKASKRARNSKGSTISIPVEGPIPSCRFGLPIKAEKIVIN
ncbi:MAG: hypothetical protein R3A80_05555 [Bdellovibrionota bacterium]